MSGVWRAPSLGTPGPVCHEGLGNTMLAPPPPPASSPVVAESFQTRSGMYFKAEALLARLEAFQYEVSPCSSNIVPPIAVILGMLDGASTAKPFCASAAPRSSQSPAPLSPE